MKLCQVALRVKNSVFIIYLLEDEQELSLGMLIRLRRIYNFYCSMPIIFNFHILIALVHPLHGNPYSLTLISIDGHLPSPFIRLVDVRLSSPFLSPPQPPLYSTYSAMSMAHAHVLRED